MTTPVLDARTELLRSILRDDDTVDDICGGCPSCGWEMPAEFHGRKLDARGMALIDDHVLVCDDLRQDCN